MENEQIQPQNAPQVAEPSGNDELAGLKQANKELSEKAHARKSRIVELEAEVAELQAAKAALEGKLKQAFVDAPMRAMAEDISGVPGLFLEQFEKSGYRVEQVDGKLALRDADGNPIMSDGKEVPFERSALLKLLLAEGHPQKAIYDRILIVSRASGSRPMEDHQDYSLKSKPKAAMFGLR